MNPEHTAKRSRGIALFDFDGTLIPWDTQVIFANHVMRRAPLRRLYLPFFAAFAPFYKILGDEGLKRVFLSYLWRARREEIESWAHGFVAEWIPSVCYPEVVAKLKSHRDSGQLTILSSASPDFYVKEVGKALGFDLAFGTEVAFDRAMPLLPDLVNHKGAEKVRRLAKLLGDPGKDGWAGSHAYTDSTADLPMVRACETATVVNPSPRLAAWAERGGWDILRPEVPWKGRRDKMVRILRFASGL